MWSRHSNLLGAPDQFLDLESAHLGSSSPAIRRQDTLKTAFSLSNIHFLVTWRRLEFRVSMALVVYMKRLMSEG